MDAECIALLKISVSTEVVWVRLMQKIAKIVEMAECAKSDNRNGMAVAKEPMMAFLVWLALENYSTG